MKIGEFANTRIDEWVEFSGRIIKIGEMKNRVKSAQSKQAGQQYTSIALTIQDMSGQIKVWAYADKQFLPAQELNIEGMLKEYNNVKYIDYATAVLCGQQLPPASEPYVASENTQQAAPQPAQAPQNAPQATNPPPVDYEAKERAKVDGMCRTTLICSIINHGGVDEYDSVAVETIEGIVRYMVDGPDPGDYADHSQPNDDSGIPF